MKKFILVLTLALGLTGCGVPDEAKTDLREYNINGYITVVGVGKWMSDGTFRIQSYDGSVIETDRNPEILEGPVSLESFKRITN